MITDEEFFETYNLITRNTVFTHEDKYVYLGYIDVPKDLELVPQIHAIVEKKVDPTAPQGIKEFRIDINENETTIRRILQVIEESYQNGVMLNNGEFCIDGRFLKHQSVIDFLNRCRNNGYFTYLRIIGEDYVLEEDVYNQLSGFSVIGVENSNVVADNIEIRSGAYNFTVGLNEKGEAEFDAFIKEDTSDEDLLELIEQFRITQAPTKKLNIRFYNPAKTVEMIERLDRLGLGYDVDIKILGYPLVENREVYERLEEISNRRNIEVAYTCCHDYLGDYCQEPFLVDNSYYSELEPHGKTDFKTYQKILQFVENFQASVAGVDSNLEKTMMAYQYLNENYYYDLNAGDTKDYGATRDVDKILETDEIVCVGYANLLSLMCRRVGIPMFTYSAPGHMMNVARIVEKDENGEVIFDKICTFDPTNDCGYYIPDIYSPTGQTRVEQRDSYTFFGLDPEEWLHTTDPTFITLANALALPKEELDRYAYFSKSPAASGYVGGYTPRSYMYSMLHLMGYSFDYQTTGIDDLVAQLHEEGRIGEIPKELIYRAARSIENRKNGRDLTQDAIERIDDSFERRTVVFTETLPRIQANLLNDQLITVQTYKGNIPPHEYVDIAAIDVGPQYFEERDILRTGEPRRNTRSNESANPIQQAETPIVEQEPEQPIFTEEDFAEGYIAGTTIRKPRNRGVYETDEEYLEFLQGYYDYYFPDSTSFSSTMYQPTAQRVFTEEDFAEGYILDTDIRKPRGREYDETEEEYVEFLRGYYEYFFPNVEPVTVHIHDDYIFQEEDFLDELIPGTNIRKPRNRKAYETDAEYVEFLEIFYDHFFPNIEPETVTITDESVTFDEEPIQEQVEVQNENRETQLFSEEDFSDELIPGTNIRKPRWRKYEETDEEYIEFLSRFYDHFFPEIEPETVTITDESVTYDEEPIQEQVEVQNENRETQLFSEEDFSDELIPGTNIRKPRWRKYEETDEEYVEFLSRFYEHFFPNIEPQTVTINSELEDMMNNQPSNEDDNHMTR